MSPCAPLILIRGFPLLINPFQGGVYLRGKQRKTLQGIPWPSGGGLSIRCWHYTLLLYFVDYHMVVSWNRGTPKSSILMGFSFINQSFWDTPFMDIYGAALHYPVCFLPSCYFYRLFEEVMQLQGVPGSKKNHEDAAENAMPCFGLTVRSFSASNGHLIWAFMFQSNMKSTCVNMVPHPTACSAIPAHILCMQPSLDFSCDQSCHCNVRLMPQFAEEFGPLNRRIRIGDFAT